MATMTPDEVLLAYHRRHPGATSAAFGDGVLDEGGGSSYDLLAALPEPGQAVLDLGCGDGFLLERLIDRGAAPASLCGVDMSPDELAAARARPRLDGVRLECARAQALPLADGSVDWILSHLAFMLMSDVEAVVAEIARVLRRGGSFATVVGGGPAGAEAFDLFLEVLRDVYAASPPIPRLGDKRLRHAEGLAELMRPETGFEPDVRESRHALRLDGPAEAVWERLATVYEMLTISEDGRQQMRRRFLEGVAKLAAADGTVPCALALRLLVVRRAG